MRSSDSLTRVLATWGAIVSSIGLGWNMYRDLHDRARLKTEARVRRIVQRADGAWFSVDPDLPIEGASEELFVVVDVTNIGRRPVQWEGWGGKYRKKENGKDGFTVMARALPKMLKEGESHSEYTDEDLQFTENLKKLFIWDPTGRKWNVSRRSLNKLRTDSRRLRAQA